MISKKCKYAIKALLYLADFQEDDRSIFSTEIAEKENIPQKFLETMLLLPGWWSIALGATSLSSMVWVMMLFLIGAIATRAAGCIINDMWGRKSP